MIKSDNLNTISVYDKNALKSGNIFLFNVYLDS